MTNTGSVYDDYLISDIQVGTSGGPYTSIF